MRGLALCVGIVVVSAGCRRGTIELPEAEACPTDAPVLGEAGANGLDAFDLDWVAYDRRSKTSRAAPVHVRIPDDIVSYSITVDAGEHQTALGIVRVDGTYLVDINEIEANGFDQPPFFHTWAMGSSLVLPITADVLATPGCLTVVPVADGDPAGAASRLTIASRRGEVEGLLDLNVVTVEGVELSDEDLEAAMERVGLVLEDSGLSLGNVEYYEVPGERFVGAEDDEGLAALRSAELDGAPERSMNLFVIQDFTEGDGTLGFAAGIPGPIGLQATASSGVVIAVDAHLDGDFAFDPDLFGETAAHEFGHQLGLFHTTEADGLSHDPLPDTPQCDADTYDEDGDREVSAEECESADGRHAMFWTAAEFEQVTWSDDQRFVLRNSPSLR